MFFHYYSKMGKFVLSSDRITSRESELLVRIRLFWGENHWYF